MHRTPFQACIYVIAAGPDGPCKIGRAGDAKRRLASLQIGNPDLLTIWSRWQSARVGLVQLERLVHSALMSYHLRGEWFDISVAEADALISSIDDAQHADIAAFFDSRRAKQ